ncbi:MAG TPA: outer membrane lipoprotein-sorting protein [bacterium]|nr:outer membrane lipoprotein-sorting protein [bacterium]
MKNIFKIIGSIVVIFPSLVFGQTVTGDEIIAKVNELMNQKSSYAVVKMNIETTSGQQRTFEYESWSKNGGEKILIRYTKPRRAKDQAILMLNNADDIWAFFPRTNRVRKLATHAKKQKMQGSDFSYEDMGSGNAFITDFDAKLLGEEEIENYDCYELELKRKDGVNSSYSRLIIWVIKKNYVPIVIDYYDEDDPESRVKRLVQYDIQNVDGIPTGMKIIMYNKQNNTQTSMEFLDIKYNVKIDEDLFTERRLRK